MNILIQAIHDYVSKNPNQKGCEISSALKEVCETNNQSTRSITAYISMMTQSGILVAEKKTKGASRYHVAKPLIAEEVKWRVHPGVVKAKTKTDKAIQALRLLNSLQGTDLEELMTALPQAARVTYNGLKVGDWVELSDEGRSDKIVHDLDNDYQTPWMIRLIKYRFEQGYEGDNDTVCYINSVESGEPCGCLNSKFLKRYTK